MELNKKERILWMDIFKGIGIILVVMGHIYENRIICQWIYSFHMPLFFFASGVLFRPQENRTYFKNKFFSILVPYFIIGTLELIYWYLLESKFRETSITLGESIYGLLTGNYAYLTFNVHLWFLPCMFLLMILYNCIRNSISKKKSCIVIIALASIQMFVNTNIKLPFSIESIAKYAVFYLIGNLLNENKLIYNKIYNLNNRLKILFSVLLLIISFLLSYFNFTVYILYYICAMVGIIAIMLVSMVLENKVKILQQIGKITLLVLCIHGPIYRIIVKVLSMILGMTSEILRTNIILSSVVAVITIFICYLINNIILRFCPFVLGKISHSNG